MKKIILTIIVLSCGSISFAAEKSTKVVDLEPIVVTPSRFEAGMTGVTGPFSVVSYDEIEQTAGNSVAEVLRKEEGIVVRDYYGNGARTSVDMRGFGETAPVNTLVLIDGRRINSPDLSGADWSQIAKEDVERIEILRGSGSVLYGDNAAGGVINIITKKAKKPIGTRLKQSAGSYEAFTSDGEVEILQDGLGIFFNAKRHETNGYRHNSYMDETDLCGNVRYEIPDIFRCDLDVHYNDMQFGMPGALSEADLASGSRKNAKFPDDQVFQEDWYAKVMPQFNLTEKLTLASDFGYRDRSSVNDWGGPRPSWPSDTNKTTLKTYNATPRVSYEFADNNRVIAGFDFYKYDNETKDYSRGNIFLGHAAGLMTGTADVDKTSNGYYVRSELNPVSPLFLTGGYRHETAEYTFDYTDTAPAPSYENVDDGRDLSAEAFEAGMAYYFYKNNKLYADVNRNFRMPATDEFLLFNYYVPWPQPYGRMINEALGVQKGFNYDAGVNLSHGGMIFCDINLFLMDTIDEIYYDPYQGINLNYEDKTRRRGVETRFRVKPAEPVNMYFNYTYTDAEFNGGALSGNEVPGVSEHVCGGGASFKVWQLLFNFDMIYYGKSRFISDQLNRKDYLKGYLVAGAGCVLEYKYAKVFARVNNLFNKKYSELGVRSPMWDTRNYYPAPERNFEAGMSVEF